MARGPIFSLAVKDAGIQAAIKACNAAGAPLSHRNISRALKEADALVALEDEQAAWKEAAAGYERTVARAEAVLKASYTCTPSPAPPPDPQPTEWQDATGCFRLGPFPRF